tara:strand:+ start:140 stop:436 length:297 start_codon:yes stop_codon:yes gene_type:complete
MAELVPDQIMKTAELEVQVVAVKTHRIPLTPVQPGLLIKAQAAVMLVARLYQTPINTTACFMDMIVTPLPHMVQAVAVALEAQEPIEVIVAEAMVAPA